MIRRARTAAAARVAAARPVFARLRYGQKGPRHFALALCALGLSALPAVSAQLGDCDSYAANARNLIFPVASSTRSFAEGAIRVIALDNAEPVCCSVFLMVIHPDPDEPFEACTLVSDGVNIGFGAIDVPTIEARYLPGTGLRLRVPAMAFVDGTYVPKPFVLDVNQARGTVVVAGE